MAAGTAERSDREPRIEFARPSFSPDGRRAGVRLTDVQAPVAGDLGVDRRWTAIASIRAAYSSTPFNEQNGEFSPDGRWLAYQSNESGRDEIYVQAVSGCAGGPLADFHRRRNPTRSGRADGRELYYLPVRRRAR